MESLNFQEVIPLFIWAFSSAVGVIVLLTAMFLYFYYRKRLQAVVGDGNNAADLAARVSQLRKDEDAIRDWMALQKKELQSLTSQREEQISVEAELKILENNCSKNEEFNRSLRDEVGSLENKKHLLAGKAQKLEQEIGESEKNVGQFQIQKEELIKNIEQFTLKSMEAEKECDRLAALQKDKNSELKEIEQILRVGKNELESIQFKFNALRDKIDTLPEREHEVDLIRQKILSFQLDLDDIRDKVTKQQQLEDEATRKVKGFNEDIEILNNKKLLMERDIGESEKNVHKLQIQEKELVKTIGISTLKSIEHEKKCDGLATLQKQKEFELAELERTLRGGKNEIESIRLEFNALRNKMDTLKEHEHEVDLIRQKILKFQQDLDDIQNKVAIQQRLEDEGAREVKAYNKEIVSLNNIKSLMDREIEELKTEEISLKASISTLKVLAKKYNKSVGLDEGDDSGSKYRDLWQPVTFPSLIPGTKPVNEQEMLIKTSDYIKAKNLHFPERVLHAFHTALKVNEISPLVVLAGISGTGKSELPRRYAEGMGMHSITLAVQPRWDSPQDLFGFYNYLEERYKATELARAMVQFEQFNRTQWPMPEGWNYDRSDRMLLVLLDEMNLARVEYYFSEFLSRLETRKGIIDLNNSEERAVAEIALEMGSLSKGEKPIRFFPGQNVLFSGTMNEDETTQALSDKVLDRSCILRFGRPEKITDHETLIPLPPTVSGLTYGQWQTFLKNDLPAEDKVKVYGRINKLNDAMNQLNRPFAYRVALAIQSYIANYPSWVPNRVNLAMADQIEQRILPKLRGIEINDETDQPLNEILSVIEECEDNGDDTFLSEAFKQGKKSQQQGFIWRGIDRTDKTEQPF